MPELELPPPAPGDTEDTENERVREMRVSRFDGMGLPYPLALELAISGADLHKVEKAVRGGAEPEMVERIFL